MSSSRRMRCSSPSIFTPLPEYLPNRILVAGLHVGRQQFALLGHLALAHRDDLALLWLFLGGVRNDDSALALLFFLDAFDQNPIAQRSDFHGDQEPPCFDVFFWIRRTRLFPLM